MNEIIALQKYENEAQLAKELIRGFWLAHGDYVITDEEAAENLAAWTDKGHVFYFILKEEIPIGFVHLGSRGAEVDWIEDLFVLPEYQGNGYGSHAIALVEAEIKKYSESVYLEVAARNFGAMKLYHRLGYHCLNPACRDRFLCSRRAFSLSFYTSGFTVKSASGSAVFSVSVFSGFSTASSTFPFRFAIT